MKAWKAHASKKTKGNISAVLGLQRGRQGGGGGGESVRGRKIWAGRIDWGDGERKNRPDWVTDSKIGSQRRGRGETAAGDGLVGGASQERVLKWGTCFCLSKHEISAE